MPAPNYRSNTVVRQDGTGTTSLLVNKPAGVVTGDLLVVTTYTTTGSISAAAAGWTALATLAGNTGAGAVQAWRRVMTASEPVSWAFTSANFSSIIGTCMAFSDPLAGTPIGNQIQLSPQSTDYCVSGGVIPAQSNDLLVLPMFASSSAIQPIFQDIASMTQRCLPAGNYNQQDTAQGILKQCAMFTRQLDSAGDTGYLTSLLNVACASYGGTYIVRSGVAPVVGGTAGLFFGELF